MMKRLFSFMLLLTVAMTASQAYATTVNAGVTGKSGDGVTYPVVWLGDSITTYTATPYSGLVATYTDGNGITKNTSLTFVKGSEVYVSPNYPVNAGVYTVTATPIAAGDSLDQSTNTATLTILPASVYIDYALVKTYKFYDGNTTAQVDNIGTVIGVMGNDNLLHTAVAFYDDPNLGTEKVITLTYALTGPLAGNYELSSTQRLFNHCAIIENMNPDTSYGENNYNQGLEVEAYGYCAGNGTIVYHLLSGTPDQYRLDYDDPAMADVIWTNLTTPGPNGNIVVNIPAGVMPGEYTASLYFRNQTYPTLSSPAIRVKFSINLPDTYVMPLFSDVIALIDTCHCLTDIQWYHREAGETQWTAIDGANGYYYQQEGGLTGEYFVSCKMNGSATFSCPQDDMNTLISEDPVEVKAYPNPTAGIVNISVTNSRVQNHTLRITNAAGVVLESTTVYGDTTTIDLSRYQYGRYIISVDGSVMQVIRN